MFSQRWKTLKNVMARCNISTIEEYSINVYNTENGAYVAVYGHSGNMRNPAAIITVFQITGLSET